MPGFLTKRNAWTASTEKQKAMEKEWRTGLSQRSALRSDGVHLLKRCDHPVLQLLSGHFASDSDVCS